MEKPTEQGTDDEREGYADDRVDDRISASLEYFPKAEAKSETYDGNLQEHFARLGRSFGPGISYQEAEDHARDQRRGGANLRNSTGCQAGEE